MRAILLSLVPKEKTLLSGLGNEASSIAVMAGITSTVISLILQYLHSLFSVLIFNIIFILHLILIFLIV